MFKMTAEIYFCKKDGTEEDVICNKHSDKGGVKIAGTNIMVITGTSETRVVVNSFNENNYKYDGTITKRVVGYMEDVNEKEISILKTVLTRNNFINITNKTSGEIYGIRHIDEPIVKEVDVIFTKETGKTKVKKPTEVFSKRTRIKVRNSGEKILFRAKKELRGRIFYNDRNL